MTDSNRKISERLKFLSGRGFNFSNQKIADYLNDHKMLQGSGIPYDRDTVYNHLRSNIFTDKNIDIAVTAIELALKKKNLRVWKYHKTIGAPKKKKKRLT
jgi:hypothetical protein